MNKSKLTKILIAIAVIVIAVIGWYFLYFTKTPAYSLNLAKEAYTSHNLQQFKKHVDVDSIISSALDDAFEVQMEKEKLSGSIHTAIYEKHVEKKSISPAYLQEYVQLIDAVFSHHNIIRYANVSQIGKLYSKAMELVKIVSEAPTCEQLLINLYRSYYYWSVSHKMFFAKVGIIH